MALQQQREERERETRCQKSEVGAKEIVANNVRASSRWLPIALAHVRTKTPEVEEM